MEIDTDISSVIGEIETFSKIYPNTYAEKLKEDFLKDTSLWYKRVLPIEKADELINKTNGDYSEIWEDHCACCFKEINKNTTLFIG